MKEVLVTMLGMKGFAAILWKGVTAVLQPQGSEKR
jgi:hypothetical protein